MASFSALVALLSAGLLVAAPPTPTDVPAPAADTRRDAKADAKRQPPLLREGSFIARLDGQLRWVKGKNEWAFVPSSLDASGLEREIITLPNETLGEAIRTVHLAPSPIRFLASGELFIYRGRNYLLASMMTPIVAVEQSTASAKPTETAPASADVAKPTLPADEETIAAELEKRLAERINTLPKSLSAPPVEDGADAKPSDAKSDASKGDPGSKRPPAAEVRIQSRRGHLVRDGSTGGWRFVFEGQLPDGGEPSMAILPCLLLERVEQLVRESDGPKPLLVSGTTTSFDGRTYLLPTSFRLAQGGKGINP